MIFIKTIFMFTFCPLFLLAMYRLVVRPLPTTKNSHKGQQNGPDSGSVRHSAWKAGQMNQKIRGKAWSVKAACQRTRIKGSQSPQKGEFLGYL